MTHHDTHSRITDQIIAMLEAGTRPWVRPWRDGAPVGISPPLRSNGERYRGINVLMLWAASDAAGYRNPTWLTFKQALEFGGHVKKGEKGTQVVYASKFSVTEDRADGGQDEKIIPFLKCYTVFNVEQCEGLPTRFTGTVTPDPVALPTRIEAADAFFARTGADIRHGGNRAFYAHAPADYIQMPAPGQFRNAEAYTSVLAHELVHWTQAPSRLDRDMGRRAHGDEGYAREELVAEIGAAFLCADLGVSAEPREDHASYIALWLKVLKNDKRFIFSAASHAQKAVDYLHGLQAREAIAA